MNDSFAFSEGTLDILRLKAHEDEYELNKEWKPPLSSASLLMNIAESVDIQCVGQSWSPKFSIVFMDIGLL